MAIMGESSPSRHTIPELALVMSEHCPASIAQQMRDSHHENVAKVAVGVRTGQGEGVSWETPRYYCAHSSFVGPSSSAIAPASFLRSQESWLPRQCHGHCSWHPELHCPQGRHPVGDAALLSSLQWRTLWCLCKVPPN